MKEERHLGYLIKYNFTGADWEARIYRPGSGIIMSDGIVTATKDEGEGMLLARARSRIDYEEKDAGDADQEKSGETQP